MSLPKEALGLMRETLLNGGYSLLLGAGASRDSKDSDGARLPLGDELRQKLVELKGIRPASSLARAYAQLSDEEVRTHITDAFSGCIPGPSVQKITEFVWKRIYTFNVDDCLERAYLSGNRKQKVVTLTHKSVYRHPDDPSNVDVVHVHGYTAAAADGYIFSLAEYASGMGPGNPWINVLAQTLTSDPFIIAGTNLEEPDLEYFLKGRSRETVRTDRGPSFLIEPSPDRGTLRDCERHGIQLYKGTVLEFLNDIDAAFPARPLPANASAGIVPELFKTNVTARELALFSRYFTYIVAKSVQENSDLSFFVGREPTFVDIALGRDVARSATANVTSTLRNRLSSTGPRDPSFILYEDNAGTGKSTIARRAVFDLASEGYHVFAHDTIAAIDLDLCVRILNNFKYPFVLFCDDFADYSTSFSELYRQLSRRDFVVFGVERSYRAEHVRRTLAGLPSRTIPPSSFLVQEARSLIDKMDRYGLTAAGYKSDKIANYASEITNDSIAIGVCRIMSDFHPIQRIVGSLVQDSDNDRLERYLACSLATYCYRAGLYYPILASSFPADHIKDQFSARDILPLAYTDPYSREYVAPANPVLSQRVLREVAQSDLDQVFDVFCGLGAGIASYVDRSAVWRKTPEARLAGRLFDYDEVVLPILGARCEEFYVRMQRFWAWNSRYWEQCALMKLDEFTKSGSDKNFNLLTQAISHAKHAVAVEKHQLPLTTLGKVLFESMKYAGTRSDSVYQEAFEALTEAIKMEGRMSRSAIHPYMMILSGTLNYVKMGFKLNIKQITGLRQYAMDVEKLFPYEQSALITLRNLQPYLD